MEILQLSPAHFKPARRTEKNNNTVTSCENTKQAENHVFTLKPIAQSEVVRS